MFPQEGQKCLQKCHGGVSVWGVKRGSVLCSVHECSQCFLSLSISPVQESLQHFGAVCISWNRGNNPKQHLRAQQRGFVLSH